MDARKEGLAMIVVSVSLMACALLLSSGYSNHPQAGLLYSLQKTMTLIDYTHCAGRVEVMGGSMYESTFNFVVMTKYVLAGLLLIGTYGILLVLGVVPSIKGFIKKAMQ